MPPSFQRLAWPAVAILAAGLTLHLAVQNRRSRDAYADLRRRATLPHSGLFVPTFTAETISGDSLRVGSSATGHRQLLVVFNTSCQYCQATLPLWKQVAALAGRTGTPPLRVVGISLDSAATSRAYATSHAIPFPVINFPERKLAVLYRALTVPQTLILDAEGRVLYARVGAYMSPESRDSLLGAVMTPPPRSRAMPLASGRGGSRSN